MLGSYRDTRGKFVLLGSFEIKSGNISVGDPCYGKQQLAAIPAKNGKWVAFTEYDNRENAILIAHHEDFGPPTYYLDSADWEKNAQTLFNFIDHDGKYCPVDSGQAGVFDAATVDDPNAVEVEEVTYSQGPWYQACCELTLHPSGAGVLPFGCVSSSGCGDGMYDVYVKKDKGKVAAVMIVFLEREEIE